MNALQDAARLVAFVVWEMHPRDLPQDVRDAARRMAPHTPRPAHLEGAPLNRGGSVAKTVYIAGPMTGLPEYNYPAFNAAAAQWRADGWTVFNPAEHTLPTDEQEATLTPDEIRALYMRKDIEWVMQSDAVAVLPGWERSKGAAVEVSVARILCLPILCAVSGDPIENIVDG